MGIAVAELAEKINEQVGINRAASRRMAKTLIEMANDLPSRQPQPNGVSLFAGNPVQRAVPNTSDSALSGERPTQTAAPDLAASKPSPVFEFWDS